MNAKGIKKLLGMQADAPLCEGWMCLDCGRFYGPDAGGCVCGHQLKPIQEPKSLMDTVVSKPMVIRPSSTGSAIPMCACPICGKEMPHREVRDHGGCEECRSESPITVGRVHG